MLNMQKGCSGSFEEVILNFFTFPEVLVLEVIRVQNEVWNKKRFMQS